MVKMVCLSDAVALYIYISAQMMEAAECTELIGHLYQTTHCHMLEDSCVHYNNRDKFRSSFNLHTLRY
jgi:hypothetical protein